MNQQPRRLLKKSRKRSTERLSTGSKDNVDEDCWISTYPKPKTTMVDKKSKSSLLNVNESDLSDSDDSLPLGSSARKQQKEKAKPSKFSKKLNGNNKKCWNDDDDCSSSSPSSHDDESVTKVKKKSLLEYSKKSTSTKKQSTNTNITTKQSKVQVTTKPKSSKQKQAAVAGKAKKEKKHTKISRTSINKISTAGVRNTAPIVSNAQNKANQVPISEDITSISQLQWYKKILSHTDHEFSNKESLQPCRILSQKEAMKYQRQQQQQLNSNNNNNNEKKNIVIQYIQYENIHKGTYKIVHSNTLIPMGYKSKDGLSFTFNDDYLSRYMNESRYRSNIHALESERLYLHRVFNAAREMERMMRMKKEYDDYCNDDDDDDVSSNSNSSSRSSGSSGSGNNSSDDDDDIKVNTKKKTLRGRIMDEKSSRKARGRVQFEVELNNTDDDDNDNSDDDDEFDDLEVPYTQAITFDPDDLVGDEEQSNEPIRPGDVIEYYSPIHVAGDPRGLRQATVLSVDPDDETPLVLSNGEGLPSNTKSETYQSQEWQ